MSVTKISIAGGAGHPAKNPDHHSQWIAARIPTAPERNDMESVVKKFPEAADERADDRPSRAEAEAAVKTLLRWIGEDPSREGLLETPARVVKAYEELFGGYQLEAGDVLGRTFQDVSGYDDMVLVRDIDFLVSSKNPESIIDFFTGQACILSVSAKGDTKASVILEGGIQGDLRVVSDAEYPFAQAYFTGSKEHNIAMRQRAIARGLRLNEYGLFKSTEETRDPKLRLDCKTEEDIFAALDLAYIPPELREDKGEFDAGEAGKIPRLIEWTNLKGSLHNHSNWSDGAESLEEIADHMSGLGCDYWAITDHSRASFQANGLDEARLRKQIAEVARVNQQLEADGNPFRLLSGIEVDILKTKLDFDDTLLAELDVVVASLHVAGSNEADNTGRLIAAAENPNVHMLGHLTGRLLLRREAYPVNQHAVIDTCAATGTWLELNANPYRFDLDWRLWQHAKAKGGKCVINTDAHRNEHAGFLRLGTGIARKGWLTANDVINTLPLPKLRKELAKKRNKK